MTHPGRQDLEDLAAFRAVHSSVVLYPSCANQTSKLVAAMADGEGIRYLDLGGVAEVGPEPGEGDAGGEVSIVRGHPDRRPVKLERDVGYPVGTALGSLQR